MPGPPEALVDVMLFMPEETFGEIHGHATRLKITDSELFTACWLAARGRDADQAVPRMLPGSGASGAVYLLLATTVRDDVLAFARAQDRSMSWAFLKAWDRVRAQVAALMSSEQFARWRVS